MKKQMFYLWTSVLILTSCSLNLSSSVKDSSSSLVIDSSFDTSTTESSNEISSLPSDSSSSEIISSESSSLSSSSSESSSSLSSSSSIQNIATSTYKNSVYNNEEIADPSIIYDSKTEMYYIFSTGASVPKVLRSGNMTNWYKLSKNIEFSNNPPSWGTAGAGLWAPDIEFIDNKYVLYYSLSAWGDSNPGIGRAVADNITGPFTDLGPLFRDNDIGVNNSIDPEVFTDNEGKVWLMWGSMRGNYILRLSADGLNLFAGNMTDAKNSKIRVAGLDTSIGWTASTYEGQLVTYREGYYYLWLSTGTCCSGASSTYKVIAGRSLSPTGPFLDNENRDLKSSGVGTLVIDRSSDFYGPGHHTVIEDVNGDLWMYYHAYQKNNTDFRVLLMDKILFDLNGWPYVENLTPSNVVKTGPAYYESF
jgi:arabinan endo-1,5-alpha-L-arabinosidase